MKDDDDDDDDDGDDDDDDYDDDDDDDDVMALMDILDRQQPADLQVFTLQFEDSE
jgi:hypothetical protein